MRPELKTPACPDPQMISLFYDGELPSPWKEKMEAHLETCSECQAALAGYKNIGKQLREEPKNLAAAQDRVWEQLAHLENGPAFADRSSYRARPPRRWAKKVWSQNITLPLPVAAAAVLVFVVFFALVGIRSLTRPTPVDPVAAMGIGLDDFDMLPIQDMNGVLQYLSSQDNVDFMVISLPEIRKFSRIGEPALINAADYSRRSVAR